jgi:hypothetical protein
VGSEVMGAGICGVVREGLGEYSNFWCFWAKWVAVDRVVGLVDSAGGLQTGTEDVFDGKTAKS